MSLKFQDDDKPFRNMIEKIENGHFTGRSNIWNKLLIL